MFFTYVGIFHTSWLGKLKTMALRRYLAESNCVGMCQNLCKVPVQIFFTQELGMPLTMNPNFENKSCKMIFGQQPPPLEEDEASQQPCLPECQMATSSKRKCNKLQ